MQTSHYHDAAGYIASRLAKDDRRISSDEKLYYYNSMSMTQLRLNNFDSAKISSRYALKLASQSKDSVLISDSWKMMAFAFNNSGLLDSAAYFTRKLLHYSERTGDKRQYRSALTSMATILIQSKRPLEALAYYREATLITEQLGDTSNFVRSYYNLGGCLINLKKFDSARIYLDKASMLAERLKQPDLLMLVYGELSECFLAMGRKEDWKTYQLKAYKIAEQLGNKLFLAICNSSLAQAALSDHDLKNALKYGGRADSLMRSTPYPEIQRKVDSTMYVANKKLDNYAASLEWYESFTKLKERMTNDNQASLLNRMMVELGMKEKNLTIEKQDLDIRSKKRQLQLLVLLLFMTSIFITVLINYFIKTRRFRETLYRKEKYLDKQIVEMLQYKFPALRENRAPSGNAEIQPDLSETDASMPEDPIQQEALYGRLIEAMEKEKLYLDPDLNLKTLINLLGTNKKYLYLAISGNTAENFRGMINRYRVNEAKRIIEMNISNSVIIDTETIYSAAGFNSAVSFYRAFKLQTGLTPKEYANETRKELKNSGTRSADLFL